MLIGLFACFHGTLISGTQLFQENRPFSFQARVVLKPLISLIGRLVACSARINVDTQAGRQTDKPTTVSLAAHARRGLINTREPRMKSTEVQTLGELRMCGTTN